MSSSPHYPSPWPGKDEEEGTPCSHGVNGSGKQSEQTRYRTRIVCGSYHRLVYHKQGRDYIPLSHNMPVIILT